MTARALIVTGAGSGIGQAAACQAAADGWVVHALDTDHDALEVTEHRIRAAAGICLPHPVDVTDDHAMSAVFAAVANRPEPVRGLVAAAAVDRGGLAHELDPQLWRSVIEVNVNGTFIAARHALRAMMAGEGGSVVLCGSPAAEVGFADGGATAYAASKGAVAAMTTSLAVDYAAHGIRVNAIVPGPTDTPLMWANVPPAMREQARSEVEAQVPLGRLASPGEIAHTVLWLLSEHSSYTTGSLIRCDGGVLAKASISL